MTAVFKAQTPKDALAEAAEFLRQQAAMQQEQTKTETTKQGRQMCEARANILTLMATLLSEVEFYTHADLERLELISKDRARLTFAGYGSDGFDVNGVPESVELIDRDGVRQ
jgi:hypothetical protein